MATGLHPRSPPNEAHMIAPPIPPDEAQRLAALRSLDLDGRARQERLDRLTREMTRTFRVPMAFIGLVDAEDQYFKSACGIAAAKTPRALSFCGHALFANDMMVVPDSLL